ncbi:MAG: transglutaminase-like domain-containing protein [Smithella sp.]
MRHRIGKAIIFLVIFFFSWTSGGLYGLFNAAYAAVKENQKSSVRQKHEPGPEEKFQMAVEDIKAIIHDKLADNEKRGRLKAKRNEIESFDGEIRSQFAATEKKLKEAGLPAEILQRHHNFVKHYEDNLRELRANIDAADKAKTKEEFSARIQKVKNHLEKVAPARRHKPLDPNKLPHRISDIKRKEPRTKPSEFLKDIKQTAGIFSPSDNSLEAVSFRSEARNLDFLTKDSSPRYNGIRNDNNNVIPQPSTVIPVKTGIQENQSSAVIPRLDRGIQKTDKQPILLASNGSWASHLESLPKVEKQLSPEPLLLAQAGNPPADADLAETIDVQLTPAIRAKAQELGYSPVKIYNWVRNNVEYVPTYGSIQGADMCLQTLQGNDFDIASLLIALLRASNIHARYVYGTIELPIDKIMNWVGGFTNANAAVNFIASGGTPVVGLISGGKIVAARKEHVWVEAYVKYYPLRGAAHKTGQGDTWIPLDASYKQYNFTQGIDIKTAVPFDTEAFVNQIKTTATIDEANSSVTNVNSAYIQEQMQSYQAQVQAYIEQNYPDATVDDVWGKKEIIKQEFSYLLGTLPYRKSLAGVKFSEIPDSLRHKVRFELTNPLSYESDFTYTISLPALSDKRITLSYSAASQSDKDLISSKGTSNTLPAYLVKLRPELKIDGVTKAMGATIGMGTTENFTMTFIYPGNIRDTVANDVLAGEYYAIAINHGLMNETLVQNRINRLNATNELFKSGQLDGILLDDVIGEFLYALAATYFYELDTFSRMNARISKIASARMPSEAILSYGLNISYLYSIPYIATLGSLIIDVDRDIKTVAALDGNADAAREYMTSTGLLGSALEHGIFEQASPNSEAISAVKALSIANSNGIPIYQINKNNVSQILPQLQVSNAVKTDIANSINAGKEVTISKTNISLHNWSGVGYIVKDPNTGAAAYLISGGHAGGSLVDNILNNISSLYTSIAESSEEVKNELNERIKNFFIGVLHFKDAMAVPAAIGAILTTIGAFVFFAAELPLIPAIICLVHLIILLFVIYYFLIAPLITSASYRKKHYCMEVCLAYV